jgi:Mg2+-importing ATPase
MTAGPAFQETALELMKRLETSEEGLSSEEAARRAQACGPNEMATVHVGRKVLEVIRSILNPLVVILLVAGTASAFLGEPLQAALIAAMVALGAGLNLWQTFRSGRAVRRLQAQITPTATAGRDHQWRELPRRDIVVGDVIRLSAGDLVPADARLLGASDLHVHQAALTGESMPAEKRAAAGEIGAGGPDVAGLVYLGTSVVSGTGTAVVFATGQDTAFGDVVQRLAARPDETEFERGTHRFGMLIMQTVTFLVLFVLVINLAFGRDAMQSVLFSVALAVGLTPEFLPMITSVTLAQGAIQMARDKVIVKHLSAIQNLGSIDVLCSDKTGTLTAGTMAFESSLDPHGDMSPRAIALAHVNSRFETGIASPLDRAILEREVAGADRYRKLDEIPFDFDRRRLSVVVDDAGAALLITKGAPEGVLAACRTCEVDGVVQALDAAALARCEQCYRDASARGFRVLAVAYRSVPQRAAYTAADEHDLTLAGFVTFTDHTVDGIADSIARLRADGVQIKILTGDNELVSRHLCEQVGLDGARIVLGSELEHMHDAALARVAEEVTVFARVSPVQKHRIVRALKAGGHVVGFLGDGINDAPSLHGADVGISVANAVDVAREASDIILLERHLDVLHAGILAGRRSFGNVLKYLLMGTSSNFGNMFSMAGAALFLPFLPMLPMQILLNNFLYDLAQVTIPTDRVDEAYLRAPQRWNIGLIKRFMWVVGPISSLYDFITFFTLIAVFHFGATRFHTGWFVESLATQTLVLFVIRTVRRPWRDRPSTPLTATTLGVVALGVLLPYTRLAPVLGFEPLPARFLVFLVAVAGSYLVVIELVKGRVMRRLHRVEDRPPQRAAARGPTTITVQGA